MTSVDTNVLLDLVTDHPEWADWSIAQLEAASIEGPLLINDAELAVRYESIEALEAFVEQAALEMVPMPKPALFLAARFSRNIAKQAGRAPAYFPISLSALMPPCSTCRS
ncbi:hypothetical protein AMJ97_PD00169 (plasmid) [Rhizobium sp. N1314]|nr:hypothetical protein AMK02_PD00168 [Rhizobium sp. N731]ANL19040.1 hypothetical protein AMJ97_PD00169 [Rhizobium sp. N1314]